MPVTDKLALEFDDKHIECIDSNGFIIDCNTLNNFSIRRNLIHQVHSAVADVHFVVPIHQILAWLSLISLRIVNFYLQEIISEIAFSLVCQHIEVLITRQHRLNLLHVLLIIDINLLTFAHVNENDVIRCRNNELLLALTECSEFGCVLQRALILVVSLFFGVVLEIIEFRQFFSAKEQ